MEKSTESSLELINNFLHENLWIDFEVCRLNGGEVVLSGRIDELDDELIEIKFKQPFYISIPLSFTYESGNFISQIEGEEFVNINKRYRVEQGNLQFRITPEEGTEYLVIAKGIEVSTSQ
jgi:hypothetical protein